MSPDTLLTIGVMVVSAALNAFVMVKVLQAEMRGLRGRVAAVERRVDRLEAPHFPDRA